jgi:hypothetical protein
MFAETGRWGAVASDWSQDALPSRSSLVGFLLKHAGWLRRDISPVCLVGVSRRGGHGAPEPAHALRPAHIGNGGETHATRRRGCPSEQRRAARRSALCTALPALPALPALRAHGPRAMSCVRARGRRGLSTQRGTRPVACACSNREGRGTPSGTASRTGNKSLFRGKCARFCARTPQSLVPSSLKVLHFLEWVGNAMLAMQCARADGESVYVTIVLLVARYHTQRRPLTRRFWSEAAVARK